MSLRRESEARVKNRLPDSTRFISLVFICAGMRRILSVQRMSSELYFVSVQTKKRQSWFERVIAEGFVSRV